MSEVSDECMKVFLSTKLYSKLLQQNKKLHPKIESHKTKLQWHLVPFDTLEEVVKVLMDGAKKYEEDGWKRCPRPIYLDALMRHCASLMKGEIKDKDSLLYTAAHIATNALIILSKDLHGEE